MFKDKEEKELELRTSTTKFVYPDHIVELFGEHNTGNLDDLVLHLADCEDEVENLRTATRITDNTLERLVGEYGIDEVNAVCWLIKTDNLDNVIQE